MTPPPPDDADAAAAEAWLARLEVLRRSVDLRLDGEGRWYHDGELFEHPRLIAAFDRGLDVHPETGEAILRLGGRWCYVRSDDTPFVVRRLVAGAGGLTARLNTGRDVSVGPRDLATDDERVYVRFDGTKRARFSRAVQARLAEWLVGGDDGLVVEVDGRRWPIGRVV